MLIVEKPLYPAILEPIGVGADLAQMHREGTFTMISRLRFAKWTTNDLVAWNAWMTYIDLVKVRGKKFSKAIVGQNPNTWIETSSETPEEETQEALRFPVVQTVSPQEPAFAS